MSLLTGLGLALLSTAALSGGFYLQHTAAGGLPPLSLRRPAASLAALLRSWPWLAGFVIGLGGWACYIAALRFAPLSLVQATSAGGVGLLALLVRIGGGRLSGRECLAVAGSVGGLVLLGLSLPAGTSAGTPPGWAGPAAWVAVSLGLAAVAAFPGAAALRPGAGLGVAAGLLYAAGDVATKAAVGGVRPILLFGGLVLACHGLAFVALQLSFQRGPALATAGVAALLTNAAPILAGLLVFSERMPGGVAGLARALGFAAAVAGGALLSATGRAGGPPAPAEQPPAGEPGQASPPPPAGEPVTARPLSPAGEPGQASPPPLADEPAHPAPGQLTAGAERPAAPVTG
jgi:hypothetical protein